MTATKLPRIPDTGNTFAEQVYTLTMYRQQQCMVKQSDGRWLTEDWPTHPAMLACALVPISRKLHKLAEDYCNDGDCERYGAAAGRLLRKARALLPKSITLRSKTDPRAGYGLGLIFPDGRTNDFGQTCVIVPTKVTA